VRRSTRADVDGWRAVARSVEALFGAPMADTADWNAHLLRHLADGTAWCAVDGSGRVLGGVWCSARPGAPAHLGWLAVLPNARGRGAGRALVARVIAHAGPRRLEVVTFGAGHPAGAEAEHARRLYRTLDFEFVAAVSGAPDATPRELLIRPVILCGDGFALRPLRVADATEHKEGEDDEQLRGFEFPAPAPIERVVAAIETWRESWASGGPVRDFGIWDDASGALIGNVEIRVLPGQAQLVNLSYLVFPRWRRRGYATGAARLALDYARDELGARAAVIEALTDNTASLGVARSLGATYTGETRKPTGSRYATFTLPL
jgi:RimJ/RimL family protein N-acetyltransferase